MNGALPVQEHGEREKRVAVNGHHSSAGKGPSMDEQGCESWFRSIRAELGLSELIWVPAGLI